MTHPTTPTPIADFLNSVHLAPSQHHKSLALWPLVVSPSQPNRPPIPYVSLATALGAGLLRVEEASAGGSVPNVAVANRGEKAVLVLFGEEIVGAKQNRIANASFLVAAGQQLVIDVSCVEAGRWGGRPGARFRASDHVSSSQLRRQVAHGVAQSRRAGGGFHADQGEVWQHLEERLEACDTPSDSRAYSDHVHSRRHDLEDLGRAFHAVPGQVGFVAALGDAVEGVEIVGDPAVFAEVFPRLLRAYTIDAVDIAFLKQHRDAAASTARPRFDAPEPFLDALRSAPLASGPSLGVGTDHRLEGDQAAGCALSAEGNLVHLMAFPRENAPKRPRWDPDEAGDEDVTACAWNR